MQLNFSGKQDVYLEIAEKYKEYIRLGIIKNGEKYADDYIVENNASFREYSFLAQQILSTIYYKVFLAVFQDKYGHF